MAVDISIFPIPGCDACRNVRLFAHHRVPKIWRDVTLFRLISDWVCMDRSGRRPNAGVGATIGTPVMVTMVPERKQRLPHTDVLPQPTAFANPTLGG